MRACSWNAAFWGPGVWSAFWSTHLLRASALGIHGPRDSAPRHTLGPACMIPVSGAYQRLGFEHRACDSYVSWGRPHQSGCATAQHLGRRPRPQRAKRPPRIAREKSAGSHDWHASERGEGSPGLGDALAASRPYSPGGAGSVERTPGRGNRPHAKAPARHALRSRRRRTHRSGSV